MAIQRLRLWNAIAFSAAITSGFIGLAAVGFAYVGLGQAKLEREFLSRPGCRYVCRSLSSDEEPNYDFSNAESSSAASELEIAWYTDTTMAILKFSLMTNTVSLTILLLALGGRWYELRRERRQQSEF